MHRIPSLALAATLILSLGACAASQTYPSLERRAVERMSGSARPVSPETPPPPPAPLSAELSTRLAQLADRASAAHRRFTDKRPAAERQIAAAGSASPGSEGWATALVALADLESSRSDATTALADLDDLYTDETIAASRSGDRTRLSAITAARDRVSALIGEEDAVLTRLHGRVGD
jgi:hypothetical protein